MPAATPASRRVLRAVTSRPIARDCIAYRVTYAAELLGISPRQLRYRISTGAFPADGVIREGRAVRIWGAALNAYAESLRGGVRT